MNRNSIGSIGGHYLAHLRMLNLGLIVAAISLTESPLAATDPVAVPGIHMESGTSAHKRGDFREAVIEWGKAVTSFAQAEDTPKQIDALRHQARAYESIGQYTNGLRKLREALGLARESKDRARIAAILGEIGNIRIAIGSPAEAFQALTEALKMAGDDHNSALAAGILNNMGNFLVSQEKFAEAVKAYRESGKLAAREGNETLKASGLTNTAITLIKDKKYEEARRLLNTASSQATVLPDSHDKAFMLINIGLGYDQLSEQLLTEARDLTLRANTAFRKATAVAAAIKDSLAESYALGYRGALYEKAKRYPEGLQLTRRAVVSAQSANAPESLYRWEWQMGRILKDQGNIDAAIDTYRRAVATLQTIRQEMRVGYAGSVSSFRDSVGPVYFQLVDLLLHPDAKPQEPGKAETTLREARNTVELFKAAELRDYFRDDCVDNALAKRRPIEDALAAYPAAIVYPIILPDRLEILVTLPAANGRAPGENKIRFARYTKKVGEAEVIQEIRQLRRRLEKRTTREYLPHAQNVYKLLIGPELEQELKDSKIETLVFVPDGALRTIPMGALHDGKKFLIEKYAVAVAPGIDLTDPRPLSKGEIHVLAAGLTEGVQGFGPLPFVAKEMKEIENLYGGKPLLNQAFSSSTVEKEMRRKQFNIVHLASHGQFSGDVDKTFILTFDDKLTMDRLDDYIGRFRFRDHPLELLTLSACETAAGDDRAALGLAGIAVKAGARSAIATLWFINDQASSVLVSEFYRQLKGGSTSRAVALQRAQVKLIETGAHPALWSPFLLINNWL